MSTTTIAARSSTLTIGLCFIVALLEGMDIQSAGIVGPSLAAQFALSSSALGLVFSASIMGLLPGALVGGWLADRAGRKSVLIGAVTIFGVFSLATAIAWNFESLLLARFLTGLGLGAAMPNLIALCSEAVEERLHGTAVSMMYCGMPLGGALAAAIGLTGTEETWKTVFYVGGVGPLLIVPLLYWSLPESSAFRAQKISGSTKGRADWKGLFQNDTAKPTILLWVGFFFTLMVLFILQNWLPTLLRGLGFSRVEATTVQIVLNVGGAMGALFLGRLLDRWNVTFLVVLMYCGILVALAALGLSGHMSAMLVAGFTAGFFSIGGQLVLYALVPRFYPTVIRGTGVGAAVAIGRLGSMSGPLLAGQMLAAGSGAATVLMAATPGVIIAAASVLFLLNGKRQTQQRSIAG
ncbi:3-(3-hydroxy-phenyl)propionate transporter MhpT [Pseudomonas sp. S31]|uniref:3-(3-hydroxy-phenyl)propionate transporter MhpT n=1 Tax=Pseudomonas sp. S31 TaxID=1564473 RepID=UPI001911DFC5|nr:3-(3-hydroxy-phenyl)propionate transporter MhpT [Pseudomonas sp. S31]MBK4999935.1 3-(3-hydroxy-phenyl)propionate transporter MhpT [Pseudomonas sp. S31]